ncbi:MAG TPA: TIM barrel protein [Bryobacteraceae bacterium]|nr:TIM barrel protein [Bryobacteraceae bacterium]
MDLNRRSFIAASLAAVVPARATSSVINLARVSAITDEIARSPTDAIDFAHQYGLQWLSLRAVPAPLGSKKNDYHALPPDALQQAAREFKDAGIRIAFLDTPFLKFGLPGTEPKRKTPEDPTAREKRIAREQTRFDNRLEDLRRGIRASQAFDCPRVRIFTFSRVAEPESLFSRIADIIGELAAVAQKDGVKLLIENEASQNAGTSAEAAKLVKLLPSNVGINWDSLNGLSLGEKPFPDGYQSLGNNRVWSVHVKGKSLLDYPEHQDWPAIFTALERDGFQGNVELETHIFGEQQVAASHASMKEIVRLLDARAEARTR